MQQTVEQPLYQKRIPIFPRSVAGKFRNFKWAVLILAYGVYFGLPWLPWTRPEGVSQPLLFDIVGRRFFIFDLVLYPQDIFALALLLFIAAVLLFFVTGLVGRAFCGYFCFQTLWTDAFILIERVIQGERPARVRLHNQPWNAEKLLKLSATHAVWLALAFWTALTFVLYYGRAPELTREFFSGELDFVGYFTVAVLTTTTYIAAGFAREQVCTFMCPYARFQGVMYEPETLIVAYDLPRGEGDKGRRSAAGGMRAREARQAAGHGDCVDCGYCVQVCPVGIDIRDGLQYQCISCGLCVDACNTVMDSLGYPRGLIRYDSQRNLALPQPKTPRIEWKRLKTVGYGVALLAMSGVLVYMLASRSDFEESVQQVRQPLFVQLSDGEVRNRYHLRVTNKQEVPAAFRVRVRGIPAQALDLGGTDRLDVRPGKSAMVLASVSLSATQARDTREFEFVIEPVGRPEHAAVHKVRFYSREDTP